MEIAKINIFSFWNEADFFPSLPPWLQIEQEQGVINDPLGQTYSLASSELCFAWDLFWLAKYWKVRMDVRTDDMTCSKTMIATGRDCGLASWIKKVWNFFTVIFQEAVCSWDRGRKKMGDDF